jgi:hypothetical protein
MVDRIPRLETDEIAVSSAGTAGAGAAGSGCRSSFRLAAGTPPARKAQVAKSTASRTAPSSAPTAGS